MSVLLYEWRRISTLRSTWILSDLALAQALLILILPLALSVEFTKNTSTTLNELIPITIVPIFIIFMSTIVAAAFGHDYRHGTIRTSLSLFPNRMELLFGRVTIALVFTALVYIVTIVALILTISAWSSVTGGFDWTTFPPAFIRTLLYMTIYNLGVLAIVMLTRIQALGIVVPLMMTLAVEGIITLILSSRYPWISDYMPYSQGFNWAIGASYESSFDYTSISTVFTSIPLSYVVFNAVLCILAVLVFQRRDAS